MSSAQTEPKTHAFQAEVSQVLHLVVHSLYSHKEIFLRELVSNAADALDKLRFRAITEPGLTADDATLEVRIAADKEKGTLTIEDTGIGMAEAVLVKDLGTIAHSGTRALLEQIKAKGAGGEVSLIGQFGVGFYSAYLVADRVEVVSRAAGGAPESARRWASDGKAGFTVEPVPTEEAPARGTRVVLHLKPEHKEFLEAWRLRQLVERYSDYVPYPIKLRVEKRVDGKEQTAFDTVNRAKALWQRPKAEITEEQYQEFERHLAHELEGSDPPLVRSHFKVEGTHEFTALVFVPHTPPFDARFERHPRGLKLFVKRVLIMDPCEELVPEWMRFVVGVVDSDDLPLNVSRELLQDSAALRLMKKQVVKHVLDELDGLAAEAADGKAESAQKLEQLHTAYRVHLKEGLANDFEWRERLGKLVRFESSRAKDDAPFAERMTTLAEYVARMREGQDAIYYLFGETRKAVEQSPHAEGLRRRGFEVLFLTDPVDEWVMESLREFGKKPIVNAMRADLKLKESESEKEERRKESERLRPLLDAMQDALKERVTEVRVSDRLTDSPACLVAASPGPHGYMERLLRENGRAVPRSRRILEVNPKHPVIEAALGLAGASVDDPTRADLGDWIELLYDQALLTEGSTPEDPNRFAQRLTALLVRAAQASASAK
jgi:molecular chaperone HtpG